MTRASGAADAEAEEAPAAEAGRKMSPIFPVILSGGAGTRLWPLSRAMYPKQFIRSLNGEGTSYLGATLKRLDPGAGFAPPIVLCNNDHPKHVRDEN